MLAFLALIWFWCKLALMFAFVYTGFLLCSALFAAVLESAARSYLRWAYRYQARYNMVVIDQHGNLYR